MASKDLLSIRFRNAYSFLKQKKKITNQEQFAVAMGKSQPFISQVLNGERPVPADLAASFQIVYDLKLSEHTAPKEVDPVAVSTGDFQREVLSLLTVVIQQNEVLLKKFEEWEKQKSPKRLKKK